jgi:hypothetical protein
MHEHVRATRGHHDGKATAASPEIQDPSWPRLSRGGSRSGGKEELHGLFGQQFGFRPRDQNIRCHRHLQATETG